MLARTPALRKHIPEFDLAIREAIALAGLGRFEEGKARLSPREKFLDTPDWIYFARLSDFYDSAQMHDEALECVARAYQDDPDNLTVQLDYAMALLRNEKEADLAKRLIDSVQREPMSDMLMMYLPFIKGLWLQNTGNSPAAIGEFEQARESLRRMIHASPLIPMMLDIIQAYLAIALAHTGEQDRAAKEALPALVRLKALNEKRLLDRLERAIDFRDQRFTT